MKSIIESVQILMVELKPETLRVDAIQSFVCQETPIVRITTRDGRIGTGYSYTIGTGGYAVVDLISRHLAPQLIGRDASQIERIWRDLFMSTHATAVGPITALALCAVDMALWDLKCLASGLPLHVEAGGAQESLPLYTTEGGWLHLEAEALVENALEAQTQGFRGAKVKVGRPPREDVRRLEAIRDRMGDQFELMVDANQAFAVDEAIRRARLYEPLDLTWYEEPLPAEDLGGHVRLSQSTSIPIAVGESIYSLQHFREYLQRGACSVIQVDVARIGGITPWLKTAHLAEAFNVAVCPHFLMEIHVALACATPQGRWVEHIPQLGALTRSGMRMVDGRAYPSSEAGLGIEWDWEAIGRLAVVNVTCRPS